MLMITKALTKKNSHAAQQAPSQPKVAEFEGRIATARRGTARASARTARTGFHAPAGERSVLVCGVAPGFSPACAVLKGGATFELGHHPGESPIFDIAPKPLTAIKSSPRSRFGVSTQVNLMIYCGVPSRVDDGRDPLTRLASADENASSSHPLPQRGEGSKINLRVATQFTEGPESRHVAGCRSPSKEQRMHDNISIITLPTLSTHHVQPYEGAPLAAIFSAS